MLFLGYDPGGKAANGAAILFAKRDDLADIAMTGTVVLIYSSMNEA
jgi:hypothetical protein